MPGVAAGWFSGGLCLGGWFAWGGGGILGE